MATEDNSILWMFNAVSQKRISSYIPKKIGQRKLPKKTDTGLRVVKLSVSVDKSRWWFSWRQNSIF